VNVERLLRQVQRLEGIEGEAVALANENDRLRYENAKLREGLTAIERALADVWSWR
jgi:regulator of replication initiation timing